jgi:hypothetical protein
MKQHFALWNNFKPIIYLPNFLFRVYDTYQLLFLILFLFYISGISVLVLFWSFIIDLCFVIIEILSNFEHFNVYLLNKWSLLVDVSSDCCETSHVFCISYNKCASNLVMSLLLKLWSIIAYATTFKHSIAWLDIHHAYKLLRGKVLFVFLNIQVFSIIASNTCHLQLVLKWKCQLNLHFLKSLMFNLLKIKVTCLHFVILLWFMFCLVGL